MGTKLALVISDLHVLSTYALLRPGFKTENGNEIGLNKLQQWMWERFQSCLDEVRGLIGDDPCDLILNGDLIEGNHHRTKEILAVDQYEHARAASHTLEPAVELCDRVFIVEGTECHTGDLERAVGRDIGAEFNPESGHQSFPMLDIRYHGCLVNARHHMPTTSRVYLEGSQLTIQLGNAQLACARQGWEAPKVILAAHRHRVGLYSDGEAMMVVTPPWQGLTRYARKVVPDGKLVVGMILLDWREVEEGELPVARLILRKPLEDQRTIME